MNPIVAIVGRPNVGKSTLYNRIVGRREAITVNTPGVTRDRHYGNCTWEGYPFQCLDTGGYSLNAQRGIESKINQQVDLALDEASVILFVLDGRVGILPEEREISQLLRRSGKKVFYVVNKIDRLEDEERLNEFFELGDVHPVSAEHGYRVNDLLDLVVEELRKQQPESDIKEEKKAIKVALIGRPNVGKSSLLNRLLGEERVVVHEEPGTTRDVIDTPVTVDGKNYLLLDTAGIRRHALSASKAERYSVQNTIKAIQRSDLCLFLLDASTELSRQDAHVVGEIEKMRKPVIVLWNKWDLVDHSRKTEKEFSEKMEGTIKFLSYAPVLHISAKTGRGCHSIWEIIQKLYRDSGKRVPTAYVNQVFEKIIDAHNPPVFRGKPVKFFYATQTGVFPPSFVVFVNEPKGVHFSFKRYLINQFRKTFEFGGAPIQILFRKK